MIDAANYEKVEILKDGTTVRIRSVRADDKDRLSAAFDNLEPKSIYMRFMHHKKALTDADLKAATEVDFNDTVALVVTVGEQESETVIAGGRYLMFGDAGNQPGAEVAFAVEEEYHGRGIAGHLLRHLVLIAQEKGVSRFEADLLPRNRAMLVVFSRSGLPMTTQQEPGNIHVILALTETGP